MSELIKAYIESYNAKDVPGMLALLDDKVVFENISSHSGLTRTQSKKEFEHLAVQSLAYFTERKQTIRFLIETENAVSVEIDYYAVVAADFPDASKAGQTLQMRGVSIFEIRENKITRISDYGS